MVVFIYSTTILVLVILIHPSDLSLLNPFTKKVLLDLFTFAFSAGYIVHMSVGGDKQVFKWVKQDWIICWIEQLNDHSFCSPMRFIHKQDASVDSVYSQVRFQVSFSEGKSFSEQVEMNKNDLFT